MRYVLKFLVALLIGATIAGPTFAQAPYPNRPVRVIIPFGPGGFADITMRLVSQKLPSASASRW